MFRYIYRYCIVSNSLTRLFLVIRNLLFSPFSCGNALVVNNKNNFATNILFRTELHVLVDKEESGMKDFACRLHLFSKWEDVAFA